MKVLGLSGSLRRDSHNSALLDIAGGLLPAGAGFEVYEGLRSVEPYDADLDNEIAPGGAAGFRRALEEADALLIATPEYNSSVPGALKNALDWASRPLGASALTGLPVAVIGASTGRFGAVWAQAELRKILAASGARVVEGELAIGRAPEVIGPHGLTDHEATGRLRSLLDVLVAEAAPRVEIAA
jgi:chromate reductase, NAD(P)H dehydrogenase (quinone)